VSKALSRKVQLEPVATSTADTAAYHKMQLKRVADELDAVRGFIAKQHGVVVDALRPPVTVESLLGYLQKLYACSAADMMETWWETDEDRWRTECRSATSCGQVLVLLRWFKNSLRDSNEIRCGVCRDGGDAKHMLLCDGCDAGFHTYCIKMKDIPEGEWLCAKCQAMDEGNSQEDDGLYINHMALEDETPTTLANKFDVDVDDILHLNSSITGLKRKSKLLQETMVLIPRPGVTFVQRKRTRHT